jgi:hypothetical protein
MTPSIPLFPFSLEGDRHSGHLAPTPARGFGNPLRAKQEGSQNGKVLDNSHFHLTFPAKKVILILRNSG